MDAVETLFRQLMVIDSRSVNDTAIFTSNDIINPFFCTIARWLMVTGVIIENGHL